VSRRGLDPVHCVRASRDSDSYVVQGVCCASRRARSSRTFCRSFRGTAGTRAGRSASCQPCQRLETIGFGARPADMESLLPTRLHPPQSKSVPIICSRSSGWNTAPAWSSSCPTTPPAGSIACLTSHTLGHHIGPILLRVRKGQQRRQTLLGYGSGQAGHRARATFPSSGSCGRRRRLILWLDQKAGG
jgi:hypothetical protein